MSHQLSAMSHLGFAFAFEFAFEFAISHEL